MPARRSCPKRPPAFECSDSPTAGELRAGGPAPDPQGQPRHPELVEGCRADGKPNIGWAARFDKLSAPANPGEAGFTLVEELVALGIVAIGLAVVLLAIGTASVGLRETDEHVFAENLARSQLEQLQTATYSANPTAVPYPIVSAPAGYAVGLTVEYWTAPNGPFTATLRNDGMQRITVSISHDGQPVLDVAGYKVNR